MPAKIHKKTIIVIAVTVVSVIVLIGALAAFFIYNPPYSWGASNAGPLSQQIAKNYIPFNASIYRDEKCPPPDMPVSYSDLKTKHNPSIVLCTVNDIGVYREKSKRYNPKECFGCYIYTVAVDKVLSGKVEPETGRYIAVGETAWASPNNDSPLISIFTGWSFSPYTHRPQKTRVIEKNKQYVMFLYPKDETGLYFTAKCGFGVISVDYIQKEAKTDSLNDLETKYNRDDERAPLQNDIMYKISSLHIAKDYSLS